MFGQMLARSKAADSLLCVGLDPHRHLLAEPTAEAARAYCLDIIERTEHAAAAFKVNSAFFEVFGAAGWDALASVVAAVAAGIPVIVDAKRGDIGSTAAAYAEAVFDGLGADAVTINPYLGADAIEPFLRPDKGVFVLVRTSNPGAAAMQDRPMADGRPAYLHVVDAVAGPNVGYVVGATAPLALAMVREAAPDAWILAPGVGAQGADLEAVAIGKRADGSGVLVPVSRAIATAADPAAAAERLRVAINALAPAAASEPLDRLAMGLFDAGCIQFGSFTLKSGESSPVYIDLRRLISRPDILRLAAAALADLLAGLSFDHVAALPYAALPIGTAIALATDASMVFPRHEAKGYGTRVSVEGVFAPGDIAVVVDDLTTSGGTKTEAIMRLTEAGLAVNDVVVLIDRQGGGAESIAASGYAFHSVFTLTQLVDRLARRGAVSADQHRKVINYLDG